MFGGEAQPSPGEPASDGRVASSPGDQAEGEAQRDDGTAECACYDDGTDGI